MSNNIRFDYTKAEKFLSQREMESMKFAVMQRTDYSLDKAREVTFKDGLTFQSTMTRTSLKGLRQQLKRFSQILMF